MNHSLLTEMSNEELWKLFPVILSPYRSEWKKAYLQEKEHLLKAAARTARILRINHIGSTSVPGLVAKPTIDILLEIGKETDLPSFTAGICNAGYLFAPQPSRPAPHMMFMKGYTPRGFEGQTFHLHVRYPGDWDELYFRDYLVGRPAVSNAYGKLKKELKVRFEHDRDAYTEAKADFIKTAVSEARRLMPGKYALSSGP